MAKKHQPTECSAHRPLASRPRMGAHFSRLTLHTAAQQSAPAPMASGEHIPMFNAARPPGQISTGRRAGAGSARLPQWWQTRRPNAPNALVAALPPPRWAQDKCTKCNALSRRGWHYLGARSPTVSPCFHVNHGEMMLANVCHTATSHLRIKIPHGAWKDQTHLCRLTQ